jgi:tRNA nucleotidyltransferase (CCA-adding enzyme)
MKLTSILEEESKNISPLASEILKMEKIAKDFIKLLNKKGLEAYIGGSLAKGTLVKKKKKQDIDIFVVFDYSEDTFKLENTLKKMAVKFKKIHGSRDYFQIDYPEAILEVIPVVKNKDPEIAENITDVSLLHIDYVKEKINKNLKIASEIRLAKSFCNSQKCYGAESYIKGFSGYALEVLVIYFGSFIKFLKGIQKKKIIDPSKYFRNDKEILREINKSKLNSPVILVDPTYKYRNVTAGLGHETFEKFSESAKNFLKSPSLNFFTEKETDINLLRNIAKKDNAKLIEISLSTNQQEGDIAGAKMRKFFDFLADSLTRKKQVILKKDFDYSGTGKDAKGYLVVVEKKEIEVRGPPAGLDEAIKKFKKIRKNIYEKKGYFWAKEKASIEKVFEESKKLEKEKGVRININFL